jgi:hypothetical protein
LTNKNGIFLTTTNSNSNSVVDTLTNYKTQLSTNSNKLAKESHSFFNNKNKKNYDKSTYNKPRIFNNFNNNLIKDKNFLLGNPLIKAKIMKNKNKNKNFFNSKTNRTNYSIYNFTNSKIIPSIQKESKTYKYLNNNNNNNKENISFNIKNSILTTSSRNSNDGKKFNRNSFNSSVCTFYTYSKNENNVLLEVIEKNINNKNISCNKESLPIYQWLKEIDLLIYLPLFMKKKIYSFEKIISDLKSKKAIITINDIKKIGIEIPGHIYRIFVKLELDAELIDKKIYKYLLSLKDEESQNTSFKASEESTHSIYDCCGMACCSLKKSQINSKTEKIDENDKIFVSLEKWLENINMVKYKDKFIKYGFDKIEFFILQMLSSIPLEEKIFEKELFIDNNNDIDMFILQLNKDVKFLSHKFKKKRSSSVEIDGNSVSRYLLSKGGEQKKKISRTSSNICHIF